MKQVVRLMSSPDQNQRKHIISRLLLSALLAIGVIYWLTLMILSVSLVPQHGSDFAIYYAAAEVVRFTPAADLYSWTALIHAAQIHGGCALFPVPLYVYPPLLALLLEPLTLAPCGLAMPIWTGINALLWCGATILLVQQLLTRWSRSSPLASVTLVVLASACFWQAIWGLWLGQVHLVVLFGMVLAMVLNEHGRPKLAGGVLAVAACIKYFPAFIIFYFLLRRNWRVLAGAVTGGAASILVMCLAVGVPEVVRSLPVAIQIVGGQARPGLNDALAIVLPGVGPVLAILVFGAFCAGVLATRGRGDDRLGSAWAICTMLLVSPLVWSYYLVWLLPAFVAALGALPRDKRLFALLAALYVTVALPLPMVFAPVATLMLWIVVGALFLRSTCALSSLRHPLLRRLLGETGELVLLPK
jgi:hypothetical protein